MKEISLDLIKKQGGYRVLAGCDGKWIKFDTRSEDLAEDVHNLAEDIAAMANIPVYAEVDSGISEKDDAIVIMVEYDNGEMKSLNVDRGDADSAIEFLSGVVEFTQEE